MKSGPPVVIGGILGMVIILDNFIKYKPLQTTSQVLTSWVVVISGFAMLLGAVNMILVHTKRIQSRDRSDESSLLLLSLFVMIIFGVFVGRNSGIFKFLFDNVVVPAGSTFYSVAIFYIASAAYRVFRVKNLAGFVVLAAAFLEIMGRMPMVVAVSDRFPVIAEWLMGPPTVGAQRAVMISGAVGAIALGIRVLLGIERGHMSASGE